MKVLLVVLAAVFALLVSVVVAGVWYFSGSLHEVTRTLSVPHIDGSGLEVETKNGSVSVVTRDAEQVEISATIKATSEERLAECKIIAERTGEGALKVDVKWPGKRKSREGCKFEIQVPRGVSGINLTSSNGKLSMDGLAGDAVMKTSNGKIEIANHDGSVRLETSNGKIEASEISGSIRAKSSNGKIDITLSDSSLGPVDIDTSNGSVELKVGSKFAGAIRMKTSNGSLNFGDATGAKIVKSGKKNAEIQFGESTEASSIKTSNGSITVRRQASAWENVEEENSLR